ncbi:MAG: hypothetical protein LBS92_01110 [Candidatus Methanoplasma sp.]|jgi:hypothetical protein|nr:hypothetical protein [Candidatus Methanoplasma sp.]
MDRDETMEAISLEREQLEQSLKRVISKIGDIPIGNPQIMPYGWRKSAKGRTVWRIVEEIISQNLEKHHKDVGLKVVVPASSEISVYDFEFVLSGERKSYVNIKSAVEKGKEQKDDISKAGKLLEFYAECGDSVLYVATFTISFNTNMTISLKDCTVFPISWIPDIYVNPSNNGNLQSSKYKNIAVAHQRTNGEFVQELREELVFATDKKKKKMGAIKIEQYS